MDYKRNEKIAFAERLMASPEWKWFESEMRKVVEMRKFNASSQMDSNALYRLGFLVGIEFCLSYPEKSKKDNTRFYDTLWQKILREKEKEELKSGA